MLLSCTMTRKAKLLSALRRELRISDGLVRRLKPLDAFRVNGESAHTNRLLVPGDLVTVTIEETTPDFPAEDGPLDILYEDDCLIAVDKPAGLIVHPTFARQTGTLANYLLGYYRRTGQACGVHVLTRLDRDTLGVVIFAKNAWAHWLLMEELDAGRVEKVYEALTVGGPAADEGEIDLPIAKRPNPSLLRYVDPSGKPARTRYRVLERGLACPLRRPDCPAGTGCPEGPERPDSGAPDEADRRPGCPPICRLELRPLTGRTHQLRVHCAYEGFPILGDPQYGAACRDGTLPSAPPQAENEATGIRYQASGVALQSPPPEDRAVRGTARFYPQLRGSAAEMGSSAQVSPQATDEGKPDAAACTEQQVPGNDQNPSIVNCQLSTVNCPDVIVVDPPRKGLAPEVVDAMAKMAPERIVYVSCDPATLARDVKLLTHRGYTLTHAEAFDLFPRTFHVETVVLMTRNE